MRTRKISILAITAAALSLALTACDNGDAASSSPGGSSTVTATDTPGADAAGDKGKSSGTPAKSDQKCTDQIDYSADSRSNAEINSIGADTGTCPPVQKSPSDVKCTDQIDYSADSRSNAEINSIGEETGSCPPVQKSPSDEKCTDQIDYSADSRSNAEINSIGAETGTCPPVEAK